MLKKETLSFSFSSHRQKKRIPKRLVLSLNILDYKKHYFYCLVLNAKKIANKKLQQK